MKKLYTSALAALCVFGVSAGINGAQLRSDNVVKKSITETAVKANKSMSLLFERTTSEKVMSRAGEESYTVEGEYTIYIGDYYNGEESMGPIEDVATIQRDGSDLYIDSPYFNSNISATFDEETGEISFKKINLGELEIQGKVYYIRFEPFYWDNEKEDVVVKNYTAKFDPATGSIAFPAEHGFSWAAYSDAKYKMQVGYIGIFDVEGMVPYVEDNSDPNEGWTTIGEATLEDAWISPSYTWENGDQVNPADVPITAELQQNDAQPTLYRLVNPYKDPSWPIVELNQSTKTGYIVFDIADPEHVIVKAGYPAGFKNSNGEFYVFGLLGYQIYGVGSEWDDSMLPELISLMEQDGMAFDTYKDGVVTVNKSVFDINPKCTKAYTWTDNPYVVSTITLPSDAAAIIDIEANENAPVEYFNLQGVRVNNPVAGQFVIVRQGSKVTKTIVR